jgi:putative ABC transport system permease protein
MRALDKKLMRDLARMKAQAAAIALVVAAAVTLFVGLLTMYRSVRVSQHHYYAQHRFADLWSSLARAPRSVARELEALPGVAAVETRILVRAVLGVPGMDEPASAVIVSIPSRAGHTLSDLYLRRGRHVEAGRRGEVLVNEAFAEKNSIRPGSSLSAVIGGRRIELNVVGVALSPEYVMAIPPGAQINDDRRFAVLWMAEDELEAITGLRDAFNDVAIDLVFGADEAAVVAGVDRVLAAYGGRGAYGRDMHPSHIMLEEHLTPLAPLSVLLPSIFLLAAAFLVNVVMSRLIATQREQIGMLKAFGYSNARLTRHYLELTLAIVALGTALGIPSGIGLGRVMALFYADFFRFPALVFRVDPAVVLMAVALAASSAALGVIRTLRRVAAMAPIVAMSPEVPAFHRSLLDRTRLARLLAPTSRMVARNLLRRPVRAALTCAGMALAVAVVVLGESSADGADRMRDVTYQAQQRADMEIVLESPRRLGTVAEFAALPGVRRAEPFRAIPARVLAAGGAQDIVLYGLTQGATLRRVVDNRYRALSPPRDGVIVTAWLARRFGLQRGESLAIELRERRRRVVTTRVAGIVDEPLGLFAYIELQSLARLIAEPETFSGVHLAVDPAGQAELNAVLKRAPAAVGIAYRQSSLLSYREMSDAGTTFVRQILIAFSVIIAFGMVYNSARIALAERSRELATMRVLGFTRGEISRILLGEIGVLALPAIAAGFALGYLLTGAVAASASGTRMHMPWLVGLQTYGFAALVFAIAAAVSALIVRRRLDHLDLIAVLKARQ